MLKNVQLFGPPCTIPCPKKCPTLSFAVTCLHQNGQNLAYKKRNSEIQNSSCFTFTYLILAINLICCYYVIHTSLQYLQTMTFSDEDKILTKSLHLSKGYNASRLLAEFPDKGWTKHSIKGCFRSSEKLVGLLLTDVNQLKQRLIDTWSSLSQDVIDDTIDQWRVQLRACVKAKGHHFEHLL